MKKIFLMLFGFHLISAQQNDFFREVKKNFDDRETAMILQYKKLYEKSSEEDKAKLNAEFIMLQRRMKEARNNAYLEALVKTKIQKDLDKEEKEKVAIAPKPDNYEGAAEYPTGMDGLRSEFADGFYTDAIHTEGNYDAEITFVVERDGSLSNMKVNGRNHIFNQQAEIAMYLLSHRFIPAYIKGQAVRSRFRFPIKMRLEKD